jgi:protoheme IX farnesyltransferase
MRDLFLLTKFRLTTLVLCTTAAGYYLATDGPMNLPHFYLTLLATALLAGGSCALNQVLEAKEDAQMKRTQDRPLAAARRSLLWGQAWGTAMALSGLLLLLWKTNLITASLGAIALGSYIFIYTPLKKITELNTLLGALPGAIPPLIGWTAARNHLDWEASILFALLFLWQLPHFLAIAWICREDYAAAGFKIIGIKNHQNVSPPNLGRHAIAYSIALWPLSLLYARTGGIETWSLIVTFILGAILVWQSFLFWRRNNFQSAKQLFWGSILYLPIVLGAWCLGKT